MDSKWTPFYSNIHVNTYNGLGQTLLWVQGYLRRRHLAFGTLFILVDGSIASLSHIALADAVQKTLTFKPRNDILLREIFVHIANFTLSHLYFTEFEYTNIKQSIGTATHTQKSCDR